MKRLAVDENRYYRNIDFLIDIIHFWKKPPSSTRLRSNTLENRKSDKN